MIMSSVFYSQISLNDVLTEYCFIFWEGIVWGYYIVVPIFSNIVCCAIAPLTPPSCEEEEDGGMRRQKRGVLPKHATAIMKAWLFQHIVVSLTLTVVMTLAYILVSYEVCGGDDRTIRTVVFFLSLTIS